MMTRGAARRGASHQEATLQMKWRDLKRMCPDRCTQWVL